MRRVTAAPAVPPSPSAAAPRRPLAVYWRRRLAVLAVLVAFVFVLGVVVGRAGAVAGLDDEVAGERVVAPGETLWDVAAQTAPEGTDTRAHLEELRAFNGFDSAEVPAWTVVLLPAR